MATTLVSGKRSVVVQLDDKIEKISWFSSTTDNSIERTLRDVFGISDSVKYDQVHGCSNGTTGTLHTLPCLIPAPSDSILCLLTDSCSATRTLMWSPSLLLCLTCTDSRSS